ncbi:uncharacterized protein ACA1_023830 [Acanthamoeba castellanii str. Neff]|uniref:EamA domain-containing protein n=1 Tax=Acanthamoeba castellanii (strain ATCC 30010 / Neff) TaxID=1257118 RepID=L8GV04_ACACF|nr:uncharacterized protein ACA1_023830 [Acanthamoeba castellanii str. Neff]ELR15931.1 hypothetical protein ACA1_023830 [Acanthamoeba castellanii str. Neff]
MEEAASSWVWWWWVIACMMGWGGTALVLMAIEDDGAGHGGGGGERKAGKERRHRPAAGGSRHEAEALLGWGDGSLAIFSGVAAALADIAFYQLARLGVSVSVAGPVSGLYLTLPAVLGVLLLGEPLTWAKVVGLLLAMAAIYLLGSDGGEDAGSTAGTCAAEVGSAVVGLLSAQPHDQHGSDDDQPASGGELMAELMEQGSSGGGKKGAAATSTKVMLAAEQAGEAVSPVAVKTRRRVDKAGARTSLTNALANSQS